MKKILLALVISAPLFASAAPTREDEVKAAISDSPEIVGVVEVIAKSRGLECRPEGRSVQVKLGSYAQDKTASDSFTLNWFCNSPQGADATNLIFKGYAIESGTVSNVVVTSLKVIASE